MADGRGGPRQGVQGRAYSNRTDLNRGVRKPQLPVQAAPGQQYGARGQQEAAQRQIPMGAGPGVPAGRPMPPGPLDAPSSRPDEPVTAGVNVGPGPGSEILGPGMQSSVVDELRALYHQFPSEGLRELLEEAEEEEGLEMGGGMGGMGGGFGMDMPAAMPPMPSTSPGPGPMPTPTPPTEPGAI